jgi:uncharacterized membrane protein YczE
MNNIMIVILNIVFGLILGAVWYRYGERFDQKALKPKCWEILHYHSKEKFPLYIVHLKSILAGFILIILSLTNYSYKNQIITVIGAAIIGLHIYQWVNEMQMIDAKGKL